jgi:hypothetical protein
VRCSWDLRTKTFDSSPSTSLIATRSKPRGEAAGRLRTESNGSSDTAGVNIHWQAPDESDSRSGQICDAAWS